MRVSRVGILILISLTVLIGTNCSYYNRVMARKNLVDGAKAYKDRKFSEAEALFRTAVSRDPNAETQEGKTAQLFLARTLHSQYIGNRSDTAKAEQAIQEYQKALKDDVNDQSSFKAVANLYENLNRNDEWLQWTTGRANNEQVKPENRAEAYSSLAAKKYTCANEISDTPEVKKEVTKGSERVYEFKKPANEQDFEKLKQCAQEGTELIDKAIALEIPRIKELKDVNPTGMSIAEINELNDLVRTFEAAWSYKASLLIQQMRVAEMEGRTADRDALKAEAEKARNRFLELNEVEKKLEGEKEARRKAEEEAANTKK